MASSADELRRLVDQVPFMLCRCEANERYSFANAAYVERFNRTPESVVGLHVAEVIGDAAYRTIKPYLVRTLRGERVDFEITIPYMTGRRTMRCSYQPEFDDEHRVIGFVAAIIDETARRQTEEALRIIREHLDFIVDSTDIGVWSCELPFDVLLWNAKCKEHFGLGPDAVVTIDTFYERMHPEDIEPTRAAIDRAIANHVSYDTQYRTLRPDGGFRWIRAIGRAAYAAAGTPARFDGITVDITGQKDVENLLREREAHFRSMADNAPAMLWVADADGQCTYLSKQWYEYTGRTPQQELGLGWIENIHPDDRQQAQDIFLGASARRVPFTFDYRLRHRDGSYRWAVDAGLPRFSASGEFEGFVGSVIDVHERKVVEQALAETDRRKDEFLATLAHELRNPLAPLVTALRLIEQARDDDQILERALAMMGRQVTQLVRLVEDLLDVSRITRGKFQLRVEPVTLVQVVQAAVEAAGPAIAAQTHRLSVTLPDETIYIEADPTRISQVFLNLLNNAAKYTPPGGDIRLRALREGQQVHVYVKDSGIGFDPSAADRIFEMFVQANDSRELAQGGLGIGLTLVRQLVELHHGRVTARSEGKGRGSEFHVMLPMMTRPLDSRDARDSDPGSLVIRPSRILIADDNDDAAASLALLLQRDGHEVRTAHDGEEALAIAEAFRPNVVLLDIGMPRLDGYETARRLRQRPFAATTLVAALTGWGQPQDHERSRAAGIDLHFCKPIETAQLRMLLARAAERTAGA